MFLRGSMIAVIAVVCLWTTLYSPVRNDAIWIDAVSGSMKDQTSCLFIKRTPRVLPSAIETWVIRHNGSHKHDWRFVSGISRDLFGRVLSRDCGMSAEIMPLHAGEMNTYYVQSASDPEVAEFLRVMRMGDRAAKEKAVEAACDKASRHQIEFTRRAQRAL